VKQKVLLGLISYGLVVAGLALRQGDYLLLAVPLLVYLGAGLLYAPETPHLTTERTLTTDRVGPGERVTVTLRITNEGAHLEEIHLVDQLPPLLELVDGPTELLTTLPSGQSVEIVYTVVGKRGLYRFSDVHVTVRDYLHLFQKQLTLSAPGQFMVLPEVVKIKQVAIRPPRTGIYSGLVPARQGGPGVEFFGVREYQPGDPLRWVNERASARYQQSLFVNEFEQERVVDIGLILDARRQSNALGAQESLFEYGVQAAATLADTFLNGGNRVGLLIYGRTLNWTFPGYGKRQRERIMRALAQAKQGDGHIFERLDHLPARLFPVRSQLVLISPLLPDDAAVLTILRARGYRLLVISPDPISFEKSQMDETRTVALAAQIAQLERDRLLAQITEAGIRVVDWPVQTSFHQVAHVALSRLPFRP